MTFSSIQKIFCCICLSAFLFISSCVAPITRQERIEAIRNSVVSFTLRSKTNGEKVETLSHGYGTGFFISDKYIATAWHVSQNLEKDRKQISEKYTEVIIQKNSFSDKNEFAIPVELVAEDEENDIAIFSFNFENIKMQWGDFVIKPLLLAENLPNIGDEVAITGFHDEFVYPFSSVGNVAMISQEKTLIGKTTVFDRAIFSDITTLSGFSGGPLCDLRNGEVVGVNTNVLNSFNNKARIGIAANSLHLKNLLNQVSSNNLENSK